MEPRPAPFGCLAVAAAAAAAALVAAAAAATAPSAARCNEAERAAARFSPEPRCPCLPRTHNSCKLRQELRSAPCCCSPPRLPAEVPPRSEAGPSSACLPATGGRAVDLPGIFVRVDRRDERVRGQQLSRSPPPTPMPSSDHAAAWLEKLLWSASATPASLRPGPDRRSLPWATSWPGLSPLREPLGSLLPTLSLSRLPFLGIPSWNCASPPAREIALHLRAGGLPAAGRQSTSPCDCRLPSTLLFAWVAADESRTPDINPRRPKEMKKPGNLAGR